ncbi:MAG: response regulator [Leptolyngbyaceae cyanobacterium SM1_3_5]|nr:response regulator [Leptolyngbyaceae cyanobacterium SM1_3_5]
MSTQTQLTEPHCPVHPARILLVEDNSTNRLLLLDYLTHIGYCVSSVVCGRDFLTALPQFKPHLVLLDIKLPDIDGYSLLQQMRQNETWSKIPVVVVSACAFKSDQQRALGLGARRYLVKPIDLNALHHAIVEELRQIQSDRS